MAITRLGPNQDITAAKIAGTINFKNLIINGDMSLAQRGTSITGLTNESNYGSVDRYKPIINGSGTWTSSQETDVPTGQGFANSMKMACTTLDATPNYLFVSQKLEGQMLQQIKKGTANAESLTASFWVKSNKTGTYILELYDADNARRISNSYTINSADTWEKKTLTFAGDTTGTLDNDNAQSLQFNLWLAAGTNFTSGTLGTSWAANTNADRAVGQVNLADSTSNYILFTGIQLEADTSASDFEFLPYDVNLQRCQRYFQTYQSGGMICWSGTTISGANYFQQVRHIVQMRASATIGNFTVAGLNGFASGDPSIDYGDPLGFRATKQSNGNTNEAYFMYKYTADAEL
jgi:hypothetical protein